ncbi:hypothetical protein ACXY7D_06360 [Sphingomonas melonis]
MILAGLAAVPSLMIAFVGLYAFDAPDATAHVLPYVMAVLYFSAPLLVATGGVLALSSVMSPRTGGEPHPASPVRRFRSVCCCGPGRCFGSNGTTDGQPGKRQWTERA